MPDILVINDGPVRKIRINRPDKKNALTLAMYETMAAAIEDAGTNAGVRCLLITGTADIFCAGNDMRRSPASTFSCDDPNCLSDIRATLARKG